MPVHVRHWDGCAVDIEAVLTADADTISDGVNAAGAAISTSAQTLIESTLGSELVSNLATILGIIFGGMNAILSGIALGVGGSFKSLAFSLFGAIFSIYAMVQVLTYVPEIEVLLIAILGTFCSAASIVCDYYSESIEELLYPSWDSCSGIISWTSFGVSIVGLTTATYGYIAEGTN